MLIALLDLVGTWLSHPATASEANGYKSNGGSILMAQTESLVINVGMIAVENRRIHTAA